VITCSALEKTGIERIWEIISSYVRMTSQSGFFEERRKQQAIIRMHDTILEQLKISFYNNDVIKRTEPLLDQQLRAGTITSYRAAWDMLNKYFKK
jgi:LAO/AO transport system kinase